jgi:acetyltransferase-like isoleucine patch superfamily enzyme/SAM-dependent methyltransferase
VTISEQDLDARIAAAVREAVQRELWGPRVYGDERKLHIHPTAVVNDALFNLSSGEITVSEHAFFGHGVGVLTGTHDITTFDRERQVAVPKTGRDVLIERGVWVSTNALVLGPCRLGEHAVVAAGSVVRGDVPAYTVVGGVPARPLATITARPGAEGGGVEPIRTDPPGYSPRFAAIYPAFVDRFRGSETEIRQRVSVYLPRVREAVRDAPGPLVLDVGPGRGEWLALLAEEGIAAAGVEDNAAMAQRLRERGLDVVHTDATHLGAVPAGSLDVVTAFHVVEHLDLEALLALLAAARRALRPGGLLIAETPDPTNLVMGACNFHLDPTHRAPIPPARLEFLVGASGFTGTEIWRLHPKEEHDLSGLRLDGVTPEAAAALVLALQRGLFGPQDYAVVALAG